MRYLIALPFLFALAVTPAQATNYGHNFGRITCSQPVICPADTDGNNAYINSLIGTANNCVKRAFSMGSPEGLFEYSLPDGDGCLETSEIDNPKGGPILKPQCCLQEHNSMPGKCQFVCTLYEER